MSALHLAELRGSWRAWLSVSLPFLMTAFSISIATLTITAAARAQGTGLLDSQAALALYFIAGLNLLLSILVGVGVMAAASELVIQSRRGGIARLALAGASPAQILMTLLEQLLVVSAVCSIIGTVAAHLLQTPFYRMLTTLGVGLPVLPALLSPLAAVISTVLVMAVAVLAGVIIAWRIIRIAPIEALRQAAAETPARKPVLDMVLFGILVLAILATIGGTVAFMSTLDVQLGDLIAVIALLLLVLTGLTLQRGASFLLRPIIRGWTALVPTQDPSWHIARHTVLARTSRLIRTVIPVMFAVGLLLGLGILGQGFQRMIEAKYGSEEAASSGTDLISMLVLIGLPFLVSLSGAVGNLLMMSRQREAEAALVGISGATPAQQRAVLGFEGLIIGVTAMLLGLVMAAGTWVFMSIGVAAFYGGGIIVPRMLEILGIGVAAILLCMATTVLPALRSLRTPPQRVVARLIAE